MFSISLRKLAGQVSKYVSTQL